jgi:outer membrane protein assembly factor BamB
MQPLSGNNRTPLIRDVKGRKQVIVCANHTIRAFDLHAGDETWSFDLPTNLGLGDNVASMVADERQLYLPGMRETIALSLEASEAGTNPVTWTARGAGANCVSPVLVDGRLLLISDGGTAVCLSAETGRVLGRKRLPGQYMASPISAGRNIYVTDTSGRTTLLEADNQLEATLVNELDEATFASPAAADGHIYLRTTRALHCFGPVSNLAGAREKDLSTASKE